MSPAAMSARPATPIPIGSPDPGTLSFADRGDTAGRFRPARAGAAGVDVERGRSDDLAGCRAHREGARRARCAGPAAAAARAHAAGGPGRRDRDLVVEPVEAC